MSRSDPIRGSGRSRQDRNRRRGARSRSVVQQALGWSVLAVVGVAILHNGAVTALSWHLMCLVTLMIFVVQVGLDLASGWSRPARAVVVPAVLFIALLAWLLVQSGPAPWPGVAHPAWDAAPEGAAPAISAYPDAGWPLVMRFICYAMVFWVAMRSATSAAAGAFAYIQGIALFSTALATYGIVSVVMGYNLLLNAEETEGVVRASLWNRNTYATVAVFGVLANMTAFVTAISARRHREGIFGLRDFLETFFSRAWINAFGALIGLGALTMTVSRGGAAAGIVGAVVLVFALRRRSTGGSIGALAIPVVLFAFAALFMSSGVIERLNTETAAARPEVYTQVIAGILDRPVLGHGAGAFAEAFRPYMPASQGAWHWERAHSSYLENAFEFGLPAAGLLYLTLALVAWRLVGGARTRKHHVGAPALALGCLAAAAVHSVVDFSLQIPAVSALFAAIIGIGWGQSFPTRTSARGAMADKGVPGRR